MRQHTLILVKPDGVQRKILGEIISFYERKNLNLKELKLINASKEQAEEHYAEHKGRSYYDELINYIIEDKICALVVEGESAIEIVRAINGDKNPTKADLGSIRGRYAGEFTKNLVHASDSEESAKREIGIWFPEFKF